MLVLGGETTVAATRLTLSGGVASDGPGGNVFVGNTATLALDHVRVTGGTATSGGGIAALSSRALVIADSAIDHNTATGTGPGDGGGGIWLDDSGNGTAVEIHDSTIAFNTALEGGGIDVQSNTSTTGLRAVTLAANQGGGLLLASPSPGASVAGSIVAANSPANCGGSAPADGGGNVESGTDCGLAGHQNTDPQLATALAADGTLPIAATSPAVDIVSPCLSSADQRDVARPQGAACDAGAYEVVPAPPPPPAPVPTPTVTPTATPVAGKTVAGTVVKGKVLVKTRGGKYVALDPGTPIPLGSTIDTRHGTIQLTAQQKKNGKTQTAKFFDGIFKITQTKKTTDLTLTQALAKCPKRKHSAHAAAKKKKPKTRKLWGNGSGSFRTRGRYSAATVRGTKWLVQDACSGTLTRVRKGVVSVRDNVRRKTIVLRAGKKYLAKPRR